MLGGMFEAKMTHRVVKAFPQLLAIGAGHLDLACTNTAWVSMTGMKLIKLLNDWCASGEHVMA